MSAPDAAPETGPALDSWKGTTHYEVLRLIGAGGMGVVYEAFDRERQEHVALKTLLTFSPAALYWFKQEFRTLADIRHPNLVPLYELVATDTDRVFFSMQLVRGTDFIEYVRTARPPRAIPAESTIVSVRPTSQPIETSAAEPADLESGPSLETPSPADFVKLRSVLRQLVEGIQALHAAGKLHRDIKPSNVRVTTEGHVVILDFGLATEHSRPVDANLPRQDSQGGGTPDYMAPEQAMDDELTPACDWYSVGAILYEALVGAPPFVGSDVQILTLKNSVEPPPPSSRVRGVPEDLDALCAALLCMEPKRRPDGREILERLQTAQSHAVLAPLPSAAALVGREAQLLGLRDAFHASLQGRTVTLKVVGDSGMGKSVLMQHFLDELTQRGEAVVLRGRAYERESVPFKAVDSVIDALSRHLLYLEQGNEGVELPGDIGALAHIFPVLRSVPSIGKVAQGIVSDPQLFRRNAFAALRELAASLAKRRPLVVYINDAHWGDKDSAALLIELIRAPRAPPLLLVMTSRDSEAGTSTFLTHLRDHWPARSEMRELAVGALAPEDGQRLALALLEAVDDDALATARVIARESGGSPFLIEELVRSNRGAASAERATMAVLTLDQLVSQDLERLPDHARRWFEIVAVAGRPLPIPLVLEASGIEGTAVGETMALVRSHRFVRSGLREGREVVETSHDRFRETIVAGLPPETLRERHRNLARAFEAAPRADSEAVAMHLLGAGQAERAVAYAERAAEQAADKMAFDQAARLFRLTLGAIPPSSADARRLRRRLAKVLEWAGRSADAARVYQEAAEGAPPLERAEVERAAAEELLACGQIEQGATMFHRVLAAVGLEAPRSTPSNLFWLAVYRLRLSLWFALGSRFLDRAPEQIDPEDRARIDALSAACIGFAVTDPVLSTCLAARSLLMALQAGDGFQIMRAAVMQVSKHASTGGPVGGFERSLGEIASRLVGTQKHPAAMIFFHGVEGINLYLRGRWRKALEVLDGNISGRRGHERIAGWQSNSNVFSCWSLNFLGEHRELARRHALLIADAEQRGDMYTSVQLRDGSLAIVGLAADDPEMARRHAHEAIALWPRDRYLLQHWHMMFGEGEIELYLGDGAKAYTRVERDALPLKKSFLLEVQHMRAQTAFLRGRCAIASIDDAPALRRERVAEVRRLAARLEAERMAWTAPFAAILTAGAASAEGDSIGMIRSLQAAIDLARDADMSMYAAAARYQLGGRVGGDQGRELTSQGEQAMLAQDIHRPDRMAATLVPVCSSSR